MELTRETDIQSFLSEFSGQQVAYCPNPGNAGDSLIAAATIQLFNRHSISFEIVSPKVVLPENKIIFFGGGGNLNSHYGNASNFLTANHTRARRLILLPHTIADNTGLLEALGSNVDCFAREVISFAHCQRHLRNARLHLTHDLAFDLNVEALRARNVPSPLLMKHPGMRNRRLRQLRSTLLIRSIRRRIFPSERDTLRCFREDIERHPESEPLPPENLDLSRLFAYGTATESAIFSSARHLLDFIAFHDHLETDRLHLCVAGALLGKRVSFYPNSYFKNSAVYEHSMRHRFPNVRWMKIEGDCGT